MDDTFMIYCAACVVFMTFALIITGTISRYWKDSRSLTILTTSIMIVFAPIIFPFLLLDKLLKNK